MFTRFLQGYKALTANYIVASSPNASMKGGGWIPPPIGFVKLNDDSYFDHDFFKGTVGAVLRDDKDKFTAGGFQKIDWCADILTTEDLVLRFGLSVTQRSACNRLIINYDNLEVIDTMNNGGRSLGMAAAVFDDCYFIACDFLISRFKHCYRSK